MNPWFAKAVILLASIVMVVIRAPHGQRSRGVPVARSHRGTLELVLLADGQRAFVGDIEVVGAVARCPPLTPGV